MNRIVWSPENGWHDGDPAVITIDESGRFTAESIVGKRVQLPAWDGTWMQGDRYGVVTGLSRDGERFYVKTDKAGATRRYAVAEIGTDNCASFV